MVRQAFLVLPLLGCVSAFMGQPVFVSRPASVESGRVTPMYMGGANGVASTLEGKQAKVAAVKELLEKSEMIFNIPGGSITVAETQLLRRSLPEGTTMSTVKNTLMRRVIDGTDYEVTGDLLKGSNTWFFIEEDIGATIKSFNDFTKESGKKESHPILGGVTEGTFYDADGVAAIGKLPSKLELYAMIAGAIKAVPTKVARVVKQPNTKLARAIKLATMPEE